MTRYAQNTEVDAGRSRDEIERIVTRWGADEFGYGRSGTQGLIFFRLHDRQVRFMVPLPDPKDREFTLTETGRERSGLQAQKAYEQATRQRWRALALVVKAKLEAVETGIVTFEEEFGMHFVLPGGGSVYDHIKPEIERAYATGQVRPMLQIEGG